MIPVKCGSPPGSKKVKTMKKIKYLIIIVSIFLLGAMGVIFSIGIEKSEAQIERINNTTIKIDAHNICRNVINPTAGSFAIGLKTQGEWCSFLKANSRLGLSVSSCQNCFWKQGCGYCRNCRRNWYWVCKDYNNNPCP